jgi:hypothetical protein
MPANDMDKECIALCDAINTIPGIKTVCSCCGHGQGKYRIWFTVDNHQNLPHLLYWFNGCHSGHYTWRTLVQTDCGKSEPTYYVEGPKGKEAYEQAKEIAQLILEDEDIRELKLG